MAGTERLDNPSGVRKELLTQADIGKIEEFKGRLMAKVAELAEKGVPGQEEALPGLFVAYLKQKHLLPVNMTHEGRGWCVLCRSKPFTEIDQGRGWEEDEVSIYQYWAVSPEGKIKKVSSIKRTVFLGDSVRAVVDYYNHESLNQVEDLAVNNSTEHLVEQAQEIVRWLVGMAILKAFPGVRKAYGAGTPTSIKDLWQRSW